MKKLIYLLFAITIIGCSSDDEDTNPVYLDDNGVTIKAKDWALIGDSGVVNGIGYTIVNKQTLEDMLDNGDDVTRVCTSRILDMVTMFKYASSFNQDIGSWDVSNVTDMNGMFERALSFNGDISEWNVSNVTDMSYMFEKTQNFNQDISSWDVSNVTDIRGMFSGASAFNQDISNWNVSSVTACSRFSQDAPLTETNTPNFTNCDPN